MNIQNIASTLGWAENPDISEVLCLQPHEAEAVNTALGNVVTADATVAELTTAKATISAHEATINDLRAASTKKDELITELQGKIAVHGEQASGNGSVIVSKIDEAAEASKTGGGKAIKFDSPDHPANKAADGQKKYVGFKKP